MERPGNEVELAELVFTLPSARELETSLRGLKFTYSETNRFLPALRELADQEMSGVDIVTKLKVAIYKFAESKAPANRDQVVREMQRQLPTYLAILIPEQTILDDTLEVISEIEWPTMAELDAESASAPSTEVEFSYTDAPPDVKRVLDKPPHRRSPEDVELLKGAGLGNVALRKLLGPPKRRGGLKQPGQRMLAQRTAEMQRDREQGRE